MFEEHAGSWIFGPEKESNYPGFEVLMCQIAQSFKLLNEGLPGFGTADSAGSLY